MLKDNSPEEIKKWILKEPESELFHIDEIDHIVFCITRITDWYSKKIPAYILGRFLRAVVKDSLSQAWGEADDVNRKALGLYVKFLYNNVGYDWRERAQKDFGERP